MWLRTLKDTSFPQIKALFKSPHWGMEAGKPQTTAGSPEEHCGS